MGRVQHTRPEESCSCSNSQLYYDDRETSRYTTTKQTQSIQSDLTVHALKLLNIYSLSRTEEQRLALDTHVLNVGCGSGLCSRMLHEKGNKWIGFDISLPMLRHAVSSGETADVCNGNVLAADFRHTLPLRSEQFGAVLSISAIQWLCAIPGDAEKASSLFMKEIDRILKPNGCFIAQLYARDDAEIGLLVRAAQKADTLTGGIFIDFPHTSGAKKKYMCLCKTQRNQCNTTNAAKQQICVLAWPLTSVGCMLRWLEPVHGINGKTASVAHYDAVCARLHQEHIKLSTHIIRLLRRCIIETYQQEKRKQQKTGCIEYCVQSHQYAPCGGTIPIHVWSDTQEEQVAKSALQSVIGSQSKILSAKHLSKSTHTIHGPWPSEISRLALHTATASNLYFQLKPLDISNSRCKTAILTAPKIPVLLVFTCILSISPSANVDDDNVDDDCCNCWTREQDIVGDHLESLLQTYNGTVVGADIILSESTGFGSSSMAMMLYFPILQQNNGNRNTILELQHTISQHLISLFSSKH